MTNLHLKRELELLKSRIAKLCAMVEATMQETAVVESKADADAARDILKKDNKIDQLEIEIEEECLKVLALYQPVAGDLRYVVSCLKLNNDLERIGDLCCNIAERVIECDKQGQIRPHLELLEQMFTVAREMVREAIDALITINPGTATEVIMRDDKLDAMFRNTLHLTLDRIKNEPDLADVHMSNLSIARQLERIGDYATNICEDVIYLIEGSIVRHQMPPN